MSARFSPTSSTDPQPGRVERFEDGPVAAAERREPRRDASSVPTCRRGSGSAAASCPAAGRGGRRPGSSPASPAGTGTCRTSAPPPAAGRSVAFAYPCSCSHARNAAEGAGVPVARGRADDFLSWSRRKLKGLRQVFAVRLDRLRGGVLLQAEVREELGQTLFERQGVNSGSVVTSWTGVDPGSARPLLPGAFREHGGVEPVDRTPRVGRRSRMASISVVPAVVVVQPGPAADHPRAAGGGGYRCRGGGLHRRPLRRVCALNPRADGVNLILWLAGPALLIGGIAVSLAAGRRRFLLW